MDDGGEADLDLGNYERYLGVTLGRDNNITTGKIYQHVIEKERRGDYLGKTGTWFGVFVADGADPASANRAASYKRDSKCQFPFIGISGEVNNGSGLNELLGFLLMSQDESPTSASVCISHNLRVSLADEYSRGKLRRSHD